MDLKYLINRFKNSLKNDALGETIKKVFNCFFFSSKIDLDEFEIDTNESLDNIFIKFGTDKGSRDGKKTYDFLYKNLKNSRFKNYLDWIKRGNEDTFEYQLGLNSAPIYDKIFSKRKYDNIKILELGVANGHSIASWHHYFPNGQIFGIDKKKDSSFFYKSRRIKYLNLDIFNKKKIKRFIKKFGPFDYIIDDSLHEEHAMLINIKNFFPSLNSNGVYFLEDFKAIDIPREKVRQYQINNNAKYFSASQYTIKEIFHFFKEKKYFKNPFINKETQKYIFENLNQIEITNPEKDIPAGHPLASIAIIYKK